MWINLTDDERSLIKASLKHITHQAFIDLATKIEEQEGYVRPEDPDIISKARDMYADDETEIDDNPAVSHADDGAWVAAWVWVPAEESDEEDDDNGE